MIWPVTTSRLRMKLRVPWRMYSNSRRSTVPGVSGRFGAVRSRAWTPVISSVLSTRSPCSASSGARRYRSQMSSTFRSKSSSWAGVNQ